MKYRYRITVDIESNQEVPRDWARDIERSAGRLIEKMGCVPDDTETVSADLEPVCRDCDDLALPGGYELCGECLAAEKQAVTA